MACVHDCQEHAIHALSPSSHVQLEQCKARDQAMQAHVGRVNDRFESLSHQLQDLHARWRAAEAARTHLEQQLDAVSRLSAAHQVAALASCTWACACAM